VVATKPLTTDEDWVELDRGELILFDNGLPLRTPRELFAVEFSGHGLNGKLRKPVLEEDLRQYELKPEFFSAGGI
jgi:hypothetical protein